jgi:alpha-ketoglutarate-dependent taurine dioxygenase
MLDTCLPAQPVLSGSPFDLEDDETYQRWRAWKLRVAATRTDELMVDLSDPRSLTDGEREALLLRLGRTNMALYRSPLRAADPDLPRRLGAQLGLVRLDTNWLAEEDGISRIRVSSHSDGAGGFIPYTDRAIRWHTDGYYHPDERRIRGMMLHCVRPARHGGGNALLDHELAYIALRDASPAHVGALMQPDAMTIPAREAEDGIARPAQTGPVFSVDAHDGALHLRYTARTRSIEWKADAATRAAVQALEAVLAGGTITALQVRLEPGMGLVCNNVLHDRSAFDDDPAHPRLLYRARYLDRAAPSQESCAWRNG